MPASYGHHVKCLHFWNFFKQHPSPCPILVLNPIPNLPSHSKHPAYSHHRSYVLAPASASPAIPLLAVLSSRALWGSVWLLRRIFWDPTVLKSANEEKDLNAAAFLGQEYRITHPYLALLTALMMTIARFASSIIPRSFWAAILFAALL